MMMMLMPMINDGVSSSRLLRQIIRGRFGCLVVVHEHRVGHLGGVRQRAIHVGRPPVGHQPTRHCHRDGHQGQQGGDDQRDDQSDHWHANVLGGLNDRRYINTVEGGIEKQTTLRSFWTWHQVRIKIHGRCYIVGQKFPNRVLRNASGRESDLTGRFSESNQTLFL